MKELFKTLRQNRLLIAGVTAATIAVAALFTWMQEPVYESSVSLQLEEEKGGLNLLSERSPETQGAR